MSSDHLGARSAIIALPSVTKMDETIHLRLNPDKTHVLWLGLRYQVDRITLRHVPVLSSSVQVVDSARDLGVVIDSHSFIFFAAD